MKIAKRADKKDYEVIFTFRVLYDGWEMDNECWIAKNKNGDLVYLATNHGGLWDHGKDISELHDKLAETKRSIAGIKQAILLMSGKVERI